MRLRIQWVERAGWGRRDTRIQELLDQMLPLSIHHHIFSDYENEFFPVVHFTLDRLQISLHIHNWSTLILQKFRPFETSICYRVWHESRETFYETMPETLSGNEMGEVTNPLMISAASLNLTHFLWLYSWLRKVIRLLYLLLCRAALYTCKVSIATLS